MRALFIPQITARHAETESDFSIHMSVIRSMQRWEPSHAYMWMRVLDERITKQWDGVTLFREEAVPNSFYAQQTSVTGRLFEIFNRIVGQYPLDAVFTSRAGLVPSLTVGLKAQPEDHVPCVIMEPRVYGPGDSMSHNQLSDIDIAARAVGYAIARSVFYSTFERDEAHNSITAWMSPSSVVKFEKLAHVIPTSLDPPTRRKKHAGKRLLFTGRLNSNKNWKKVMDAYASVMAARDDVNVWLHSGTGIQAKLTDNPKWMRVSSRFDEVDDYYELLRVSDVAAYGSVDEGMNATVLELVMSGVVMALPNRPWVSRLFYPKQYPYLFDRFDELPALLLHLLDFTDECRAELAPIRHMLRDRHKPSRVDGLWQEVFEGVADDNAKRLTLDTFREDVYDLLTEYEELTFTKAVELSRMGNDTRPQRRQTFANYSGWKAVRDWDTHEDAIPTFTRELRDG